MIGIQWRTKALRQLKKIADQGQREKIFAAVDELRSFPDCRNVKKLKGRDQYRLRVGKWRVIFTKSLEILYIEEVKRRDEHTN
ncbi:MAG: hypothetical protein DRG35_03375 [Deltaproteobacteria bacterium]|nr:MAG: hypothetical protein DRG35_03375 [Deltaproteobacteria bacterium]